MPNPDAPAIATKTAKQHWIVDLVRRSGLANGELLAIDTQATSGTAWAEVCRVCHVTEKQLAERVAAHFKLRVANLELAEPRVLKLVPESVARRYGIIPLRENDRQLVVATASPGDIAVEQALAFASSRTPIFEVAPPAALLAALDAIYSPDRTVETLLKSVGRCDRRLRGVGGECAGNGRHPRAGGRADRQAHQADPPAGDHRARERYPHRAGPQRRGRAAFRVDGVMQQHMQLPMAAITRLVSRIKVLGKLDIADRMRPQDGGARVQVHGQTYDLRISTVPTREAEKAVIRILDASGAQTPRGSGDGGCPSWFDSGSSSPIGKGSWS